MNARPREVIWKQHVPGEALPQYHRRTIRQVADLPPPRDWGGIVQVIAYAVMSVGIAFAIAFSLGAFGGPR